MKTAIVSVANQTKNDAEHSHLHFSPLVAKRSMTAVRKCDQNYRRLVARTFWFVSRGGTELATVFLHDFLYDKILKR